MRRNVLPRLLGVDADALLVAIAEMAFARAIQPLISDVRIALLGAIAGEPPAAFAGALDRAGVKDLPADVQLRLWRAAVDAAAGAIATSPIAPAPSPAEAVAA